MFNGDLTSASNLVQPLTSNILLKYFYLHIQGLGILSTLIFTWLHHQPFYQILQRNALSPIPKATKAQQWADIGCSTGLMSRLAQKLGYDVTGYDINNVSLFVANVLSYNLQNVHYEKRDFMILTQTFDVVSATSLLSVVEDKEAALTKLISLLKDNTSTLILIEPTEKMTVSYVNTQIHDVKSWWYYKGLLLWAKAREGKALEESLFENLDGVSVKHNYYLERMVRVSYLTLTP